MELIYTDRDVVVCVKPVGVPSTDSPGGVPELARQALGTGEIYTVHRLDQVVGGVMVLARSRESAAALSRSMGEFSKEYLAVVHGEPPEPEGTLRDLLVRDKASKMTFVAAGPGKGVQEAVLDYKVLSAREGMSLLRVRLHTGRTHQIRVQFASRGMPLVGERKYSLLNEDCGLALWSARLAFPHPGTGRRMEFTREPPEIWPWTAFGG